MPWYGTPIKNALDGTALVDWDTDTIKVALATSSYVPDQDTHDFFNDVTNQLTTGGGYTAGGVALTGRSVVVNGATNTVRFLATAAQWTSATFTSRFAIVYKDT